MSDARRPGPKIRTTTGSWGLAPQPSAGATLSPADDAPLPDVLRGRLVVIRQFDVADEIDLRRLEKFAEGARQGLRKVRPSALTLSAPPVAIPLGLRTITLNDEPLEAECVARFFDFGVVSVRMWLTLPHGTPWEAMAVYASEAQDAESLTELARDILAPLLVRVRDTMAGAHESHVSEDYLIAFIERFSDDRPAATLPRDAIARLLLGEPPSVQLSETEIEEATEQRSSYSTGDLCVSGWNTALVVDPDGDTDPLDVIELANAQLLELRYYDSILDHELGILYDETDSHTGRRPALLRNYGPVLRRAMTVMLEIAEFIERVENSLKVVGDVYLARLYGGAVESLRIPAWERSVTRKQGLVQQVYDVLKAEVDARRGQLLEVTIVLLIVGELLMAFTGR